MPPAAAELAGMGTRGCHLPRPELPGARGVAVQGHHAGAWSSFIPRSAAFMVWLYCSPCRATGSAGF